MKIRYALKILIQILTLYWTKAHEADNVENASFVLGDTVDRKLSVYLPKTSEQWMMANDFFKHALVDIDIDSSNADINSAIRLMDNSTYNYVKENYGTVKSQVGKELSLSCCDLNCLTNQLPLPFQLLIMISIFLKISGALLKGLLTNHVGFCPPSPETYAQGISNYFHLIHQTANSLYQAGFLLYQNLLPHSSVSPRLMIRAQEQ